MSEPQLLLFNPDEKTLTPVEDKDLQEAILKSANLPFFPRSESWDGGAARKAVRTWATDGDEVNISKYARAFLVVDGDRDNLTSYKLPIAKPDSDGNLRIVPRALNAVAAVLGGARGGVDIPDSDKSGAQAIINRHNERLDKIQEAMDFPKSVAGLNSMETLDAVSRRGAKFDQKESEFKPKADGPELVCGSCRFFLRDPDSEIGTCQVVGGEIAWFSTSNLYISADDEARAVFEHIEEREEEEGGSDHEEKGYRESDKTPWGLAKIEAPSFTIVGRAALGLWRRLSAIQESDVDVEADEHEFRFIPVGVVDALSKKKNDGPGVFRGTF